MEWGETLLPHFFVAPFLFLWSLATYAYLTSSHPFPDNVDSHLAYYGVLVILCLVEIKLFDEVFRIQKFTVQRDVIHRMDAVLFFFRFHRQYAREDIRDFGVEFRRGFLTSGFFVFLILKNGKRICLRTLNSHEEAEQFCLRLKSTLEE